MFQRSKKPSNHTILALRLNICTAILCLFAIACGEESQTQWPKAHGIPGELVHIIVDGDDGSHQNVYSLRTENGEIGLIDDNLDASKKGELAQVLTGTPIAVWGASDHTSITLDDFVVQDNPQALSAGSFGLGQKGERVRVLLIPINLPAVGGHAARTVKITSESLRQLVGGEPDLFHWQKKSLADQIGASIFGGRTFDFDVSPVLTIDRADRNLCIGNLGLRTQIKAAYEQARQNCRRNCSSFGAPYDSYDYVQFIASVRDDEGKNACGWTGLGYVGASPSIALYGAQLFDGDSIDTVAPQTFNDLRPQLEAMRSILLFSKTIVHELGHNFGLLHSGRSDHPVPAYGDETCSMGAYFGPHQTYNAHKLYQLDCYGVDVFRPSEVVSFPRTRTTIALNSLGSPSRDENGHLCTSNCLPKVIALSASNSCGDSNKEGSLYISLRTGDGLDAYAVNRIDEWYMNPVYISEYDKRKNAGVQVHTITHINGALLSDIRVFRDGESFVVRRFGIARRVTVRVDADVHTARLIFSND